MVFLSTGGESSDKIAGNLRILANKIVGNLRILANKIVGNLGKIVRNISPST